MGKKTSKAMKGISCALAAVIFGLGAAALATKVFGAFEREGVQPFVGNTGGAILGNGAGNGLRLMSAVIAKADYAANGVSPLAETAYTITVTPTPADAVDTYTWTSTDNESVKLTPSDGGKNCKVECLKAFGTQITLTCTSDSNADVTADVTVDYVKRISSVSMSINPASVKFGSTETSHTITATPVWGTGTITPSNFKVTGGTLKNNIMEDQFVLNGLRNASRTGLFMDYEFTGLTFSAGSPYDLFLNYQYPTLGTNSWPAPTEAQLETAYNNAFLAAAQESENDGTLTLKYGYSYGEAVNVSNATVSIDVEFDVAGLVVSATEITLSEETLVF